MPVTIDPNTIKAELKAEIIVQMNLFMNVVDSVQLAKFAEAMATAIALKLTPYLQQGVNLPVSGGV